jgi:hypothetical protein
VSIRLVYGNLTDKAFYNLPLGFKGWIVEFVLVKRKQCLYALVILCFGLGNIFLILYRP